MTYQCSFNYFRKMMLKARSAGNSPGMHSLFSLYNYLTFIVHLQICHFLNKKLQRLDYIIIKSS